LVLIFAVVFFYYSLQLTLLARDVTNVFAIPKKVLYSCMPVASAIMILYSIRNIAVEIIPLVSRKTKAGTPPP
jgi:TRAP-type C4-dicarboxylate transport system permease small subunit